MKRFGVVITLGLAAYIMLPTSGLSAPLSERIEKTRAQVESKRQKEAVLEDVVAGFNVRINKLEGDIGVLQKKQDRIQATLDEKRAELLEIRSELDAARERLERLREELGIARKALAVRLVELYKADEPDALTVVLQADGFADLLERTEFLERVSEQDQRIIERVSRLKERAEKQEKLLSELEQKAEDAANAILAQRNELAASKNELVDSRNELANVRGGKQAALGHVRSQREHLEDHLDGLEAEQAKVQSQLSGAPTGPIRQGSGSWIWPVSGPVVSPFGPRWGRLHAGIDIAVPSGTPIRAVDNGTVNLMGWVGGYGNYTCVGHGGGLSSCYAHQSSFATSNGANVSKGQVIGYVGCTGHCFGDHLHFEARVNGAPVDAMGYL